jgi:hypothetical protein
VNELKFNNSIIFPTITKGWKEFIQRNHLPANAQIIFSYYGKNIFAVSTYKILQDPTTYPKYHSRSMDPAETFYFDVDILHSNLHQPTMVIITLPINFFNSFLPFIIQCLIQF